MAVPDLHLKGHFGIFLQTRQLGDNFLRPSHSGNITKGTIFECDQLSPGLLRRQGEDCL